MSRYKYKLTLEVIDHGKSTFIAEGEFDAQCEMTRTISFDIAKALKATMNVPPNPMALAGAMESSAWSLVAGLAYADGKWDGDVDFDECIKVVVDVDKLFQTDDIAEKETAKLMLTRSGIKIKE